MPKFKVGDIVVRNTYFRDPSPFVVGDRYTVVYESDCWIKLHGYDRRHSEYGFDLATAASMAPAERTPGDILFTAEETYTVSESGGGKGTKPLRYDLIPVQALAEVAHMYHLGAAKHGPRNFEKGYEYSKSLAALHRHLELFKSGEDWDVGNNGTGGHHLAAVVFHALALMQFQATNKGTDDRSASS